MRPAVIKQEYYKITNPLHNGWRPVHQVVDGEVFVLIDKYDTDFFKFCTGEHIRWGRGRQPQCHYFEFYEGLLRLRNDESQAAFQKALQEIRDAAEDGPGKRQKTRKIKMSDVGIAGEIINVTMRFAGTEYVTKMLFGCRGAPMWVHADPDALGFIQRALHANFIDNHQNPRTSRQARAELEIENGSPEEEHSDAQIAIR